MIEMIEMEAVGYAARGQRSGLYVQADNPLDYLRQNLRGKRLHDAIAACYGLLCAMDMDSLPQAYIREHDLGMAQQQLRMAKALYQDALGP